jgi:hypothetical protein
MEKNTIIELQDILGKNHDFRVCDECKRLVLAIFMGFNFFCFERWLCEKCVVDLKIIEKES